jgi:hypothetical protein
VSANLIIWRADKKYLDKVILYKMVLQFFSIYKKCVKLSYYKRNLSEESAYSIQLLERTLLFFEQNCFYFTYLWLFKLNFLFRFKKPPFFKTDKDSRVRICLIILFLIEMFRLTFPSK